MIPYKVVTHPFMLGKIVKRILKITYFKFDIVSLWSIGHKIVRAMMKVE